MRFEWDAEKARSNLNKHGVSFELAQRVWDDPLIQFRLDRIVDGEVRWNATGVIEAFTLLVVAYVDLDNEIVRIISARSATPSERRRHEHETFQ